MDTLCAICESLGMDANGVKTLLGLKPHPREGGWYARTYEAAEKLAPSVFKDGRYEGARRTGTAIYYLLEPDTFSEMHLLKSDEIFHFYAGDPVEMLHLLPGGEAQRIVIGGDLSSGVLPQVVVQKGVWQGARLLPGSVNGWALLGCTVSPGFEFEDYSAGHREDLIARWPDARELIEAFTRA